MRRRLPLAILAGLFLAGCVAEGPFPSLARRPAEDIDMSIEPVRAAPEVADDEALRTQIAALLDDAGRGQRAFEAELGPAERAVGRAGARGSESWVTAQQAISRLETARARTTRAAAELYQLSRTRADLPTSAGDDEALQTAIAEAERMAAAQQERIGRLRRD